MPYGHRSLYFFLSFILDTTQCERQNKNQIILYYLQTVFEQIDHSHGNSMFATCGQQVDIWESDRAEPVRSFTWGVDSVHAVKFNPIEVLIHDILF